MRPQWIRVPCFVISAGWLIDGTVSAIHHQWSFCFSIAGAFYFIALSTYIKRG